MGPKEKKSKRSGTKTCKMVHCLVGSGKHKEEWEKSHEHEKVNGKWTGPKGGYVKQMEILTFPMPITLRKGKYVHLLFKN